MKFEEKNAIEIKLPQKCFVYFLIKNEVVVYVGQTKNGLIRPLSHKNKEYDTLKIINCKNNELNTIEDFFIKKYNPKYNKKINSSSDYSLITAKKKLRLYFNTNEITLFTIKKIITELNITTYKYYKITYISKEDLKKILLYIDRKGIKK